MAEVTVVLPVWDEYVQYLQETLVSLQAQSPRPHIVLVENGSRTPLPSTGDAQIVKAPGRLSLGAARSHGLWQVESEFVMFWDADDIMPAGTIAALLERMRSDPRLSLVAARIGEGGSQPHHWPRRRFTRSLARWRTLFALVNSVSSLVPAIGTMTRTKIARDAGGFPDLETGDDWVLAVSLAFRGQVDVVDHLGRIYQQHSDSVWANRQTSTHLFEHAKAVRGRIAVDSAAPAIVRQALPLIAVGQWMVIRVLRPARRLIRG